MWVGCEGYQEQRVSGEILGMVPTFSGAAEELVGVSPVAKLVVPGVLLGSIAEPWGLLRAVAWGLAGCTKAWEACPCPASTWSCPLSSATGLWEEGW